MSKAPPVRLSLPFPLRQTLAAAAVALGVYASGNLASASNYTLYNISYDPTRELDHALSRQFQQEYLQKTGNVVRIKSSHGGSGQQARSVLDGGLGDVVTLALAPDIDMLADKGHLLPPDWQTRLPGNSCPYTSTIVFLVRKGNPKGIHDWNDLLKPGVSIITADPKSSGGARWVYLAAWGQALKANHGNEAKARAYVAAFYQHVPILDSGSRGAGITFAKQSQGDVLVGWENEACLAQREFKNDQFELVTPPVSILAEPPVGLVQANAARDGVVPVADAFLRFLYTPAAQEIIAENYYRPRDPQVAQKHASEFAPVELFTIADLGGWKQVQQKHFAHDGICSQILRSLH